MHLTSKFTRHAMLVAAGAVGGCLGTLAVQRMAGWSPQTDSGAAVSTAEPTASPARHALKHRAGDHAVKLAQILGANDMLHKREDLRALGREAAAEKGQDAAALAAAISGEADRAEFMRGVMEGLAARDPRSAALYALSGFQPGAQQAEALRIAVGAWGGTDARSAYAWAEQNLTGPVKDEAIHALVKNWTTRSPESAARWFEETGSTSQPLISVVAGTWAALDPRKAARWVEGLPHGANRTSGRAAVAGAWAAQNPAEAAQHYTPSLTRDTAAVIADIWGTSKPAEAAQWVQQIPPGPGQTEAAATLATVWAASDIQAAAQWSTTLADAGLRRAAIDHLATVWGAMDPDDAIAWLDAQPADLRGDGVRGAYQSWAATDPGGLHEWISGLPPGADSDTARRSLGDVFADHDPPAALDVATGISDPAGQADAAARYLRTWSKTDPQAALDWIQTNAPSLAPAVQQRVQQEAARMGQ